ncbi:MAG: hypothetical protein RL744_404 [Pseudomonadota bacterium]|jgi:hypothetical protein
MIERVRYISAVVNSRTPLKFFVLLLCFINMQKDLTDYDELADSQGGISKMLPSERVTPRMSWRESSKAIARDGDDYLRLGELPNLEDRELEW